MKARLMFDETNFAKHLKDCCFFRLNCIEEATDVQRQKKKAQEIQYRKANDLPRIKFFNFNMSDLLLNRTAFILINLQVLYSLQYFSSMAHLFIFSRCNLNC